MARLTLIIVLGVVTIAGALGLLYAISREEADDAPPVIAAPSSGPTEAAQIAEQSRNTHRPINPVFDVVRVSPNGDAVIAGRATPSSKVTLFDREEAIGEVRADEQGQWVLLPNSALKPGEHRLSLKAEMEKEGYSESERVVIIVVPEPALDVAGRPSEGDSGVLALEVPKSGDGGSRLLSAPNGGSGDQGLNLHTIDYTNSGAAIFSGNAEKDSQLFLYLNDKFIGETKADEKGQWMLQAKENIAPGKYDLRIDRVSPNGTVLARLQTKFEQADFAKNTQAGGRIIVQPGNSLWRIARKSYGEGVRYTLIFEANKDNIGDPNLIYPGQIFALPPSQ